MRSPGVWDTEPYGQTLRVHRHPQVSQRWDLPGPVAREPRNCLFLQPLNYGVRVHRGQGPPGSQGLQGKAGLLMCPLLFLSPQAPPISIFLRDPRAQVMAAAGLLPPPARPQVSGP